MEAKMQAVENAVQSSDPRCSGRLLPTRHVMQRYGVSDRTIDRWSADPNYTHLGFPQPVRINRRRYWRQTDLDAFDAGRAVTP
jgi:predicted DNA-binding transcriptional regulator AlpA